MLEQGNYQTSKYYAFVYTMAAYAGSGELAEKALVHLTVAVMFEAIRRRSCRDTDLAAAIHVRGW